MKADLLLVPHHGSKTSSSDVFLDAVEPSLTVVQAGYRNRFGHPRPAVVARCRTVSDGGRFGGYDVTYRYAGQTYHALTNYRPGRTMRVMVQVRPQFEGVAYR